MSRRICRRCQLQEEERQYRKNLTSYVEQIEEDVRTEEALYQLRLKLCYACEKQSNGLCMICGCFVEMRAAVSNQSCPMSRKKW